MKYERVPLRNRKGAVVAEALVDASDAERVLAHRWYLTKNGYAASRCGTSRGPLVYLHRFVMGLTPGDGREVDHHDRNRLDCRRTNLRVVPELSANRQNLGSRAVGYRGQPRTSNYRGVSWHKAAGRWIATGNLGRKQTYLGLYRSEEDAAEAVRTWRATNMPYSNG